MNLTRKSVFITGGTGSLGVALLRCLAPHNNVTVYSRDEVKQGELRARYQGVKFILGDVRDAEWLEMSMRGHEVVIHAAAYKQVPAAEVNAGAAIETNVLGSRNVARAAVRVGAKKVIGISTDKACAPINVYGQTKALMEKLFQEAATWSETNFVLVRYGNVLGSRGSVVPLFQRQLREGTVTITEPSMTRFWLTLDEAVLLVLEAMGLDDTKRGVILVPKAPASTMEVLLKAVARTIKDAQPYDLINIGVRAGEKLHELLIHKGESGHTEETRTRFIVYPAYENKTYNSFGLEYNSGLAQQLSVEALESMLVST